MSFPKIVKRSKSTSDLPYSYYGRVTASNPTTGIIIEEIDLNGVPIIPQVLFNASPRTNINVGDRVLFLVGEYSHTSIAVNLKVIEDIPIYDINKVFLYCPDKPGAPEGHGTVTDTRPPGTPLRGRLYYVIDYLNGIPQIQTCISTIHFEPWEHVDYDWNVPEPFPIKKVVGVWSDEN